MRVPKTITPSVSSPLDTEPYMSTDPLEVTPDVAVPVDSHQRRRRRLGHRRRRSTWSERVEARAVEWSDRGSALIERTGKALWWQWQHSRLGDLVRTRPRTQVVGAAISLVLAISAIGFMVLSRPAAAPAPKLAALPSLADARPMQTKYQRPALAPTGRAWPLISGYFDDTAAERLEGRSSVLLDNSRNRSDVLVKLVAVDSEDTATTIRTVFVRRMHTFTITAAPPGEYELRFQDVDNGGTWRSARFALQESAGTARGRFTEARFQFLLDGVSPTVETADAVHTPLTAIASQEF
jgi:hypothetical protein